MDANQTDRSRYKFISNVRSAMRASGLTVADLARATPLNYRTLSRKLAGEREFNVTDAYTIAKACGVDPVSLFRGLESR